MKPNQHQVLITGGGSGIGFAMAKKFHQAGNRVILVGRQAERLQAAALALPGAEYCVADVANADDRVMLALRYRQVNILVNNAGIRYPAAFAEATQADLEHELAINLIGPVLLAQAYLPTLKTLPHAAIINVSSGAALAPREVAAMYSASKAALHSFSKSMRWQLEASGVRVFEVLPPVVATEMTAFQQTPKGMLTPDQLADEFWAGFLADRDEMFIGKVKLLRLIQRISPAWGDRLVRKIKGSE